MISENYTKSGNRYVRSSWLENLSLTASVAAAQCLETFFSYKNHCMCEVVVSM